MLYWFRINCRAARRSTKQIFWFRSVFRLGRVVPVWIVAFIGCFRAVIGPVVLGPKGLRSNLGILFFEPAHHRLPQHIGSLACFSAHLEYRPLPAAFLHQRLLRSIAGRFRQQVDLVDHEPASLLQ